MRAITGLLVRSRSPPAPNDNDQPALTLSQPVDCLDHILKSIGGMGIIYNACDTFSRTYYFHTTVNRMQAAEYPLRISAGSAPKSEAAA